MAATDQENKPLKIAYDDMVERVSEAGWQDAFGGKIIWISHVFKISLIVLSGFCLFYLYKSVAQWRLHNGYKDEIDDVAEMPKIPFTNVTKCAPQVYFNQRFVKEQLKISPKMIKKYTSRTGQSGEDFYRKLALYLPLIMRPREIDAQFLRFMRMIIRQNPQLQDFSRFAQNAYSPCENMLKKCTFDGKEFHCCKHEVQSIDDDGVCYVIMLNFDSDNAIPLPSTFHQRRPGPAGGLTVEASMSLKDFPMLEDDADNGFKVLIDPTPYTMLLSPVPAPHNAETFIKVTPSKRKLSVNCAAPGHLKPTLVYHDPDGFNGFLEGFQSMAYLYYTCTIPLYFYRPNSSTVCDPLPIFGITVGFTGAYTEDVAKELEDGEPEFVDKMTSMWGLALKNSMGQKHCTRWTYSSSPRSIMVTLDTDNTMKSRNPTGTWNYVCDLGNVISLYWGMSLMSIFHVLYYVPRYIYYLRKARLEKVKVNPL